MDAILASNSSAAAFAIAIHLFFTLSGSNASSVCFPTLSAASPNICIISLLAASSKLCAASIIRVSSCPLSCLGISSPSIPSFLKTSPTVRSFSFFRFARSPMLASLIICPRLTNSFPLARASAFVSSAPLSRGPSSKASPRPIVSLASLTFILVSSSSNFSRSKAPGILSSCIHLGSVVIHILIVWMLSLDICCNPPSSKNFSPLPTKAAPPRSPIAPIASLVNPSAIDPIFSQPPRKALSTILPCLSVRVAPVLAS